MKNIFLVLFCLSTFLGGAQNFSEKEITKIDSLTTLINTPDIHDTTLANSYINLSEIVYVLNLDTLKSLSKLAQKAAENGLKKKISKKVKITLLTSLANALNNIGYANKKQGKEIEHIAYLIMPEFPGGKSALFEFLGKK
jgi:hypothetical protein